MLEIRASRNYNSSSNMLAIVVVRNGDGLKSKTKLLDRN